MIRSLIAALVLLALPLSAQPPDVVVREFYVWYLREVSHNKDPLLHDLGNVRKYVAASMLADIERRRKSPDGLDADPFLHAQDLPDDWKDHIAVTPATLSANTATTTVSLGGKESLNRLKVDLRQEPAGWRIVKVTRLFK